MTTTVDGLGRPVGHRSAMKSVRYVDDDTGSHEVTVISLVSVPIFLSSLASLQYSS